jgi:hypothetical protein
MAAIVSARNRMTCVNAATGASMHSKKTCPMICSAPFRYFKLIITVHIYFSTVSQLPTARQSSNYQKDRLVLRVSNMLSKYYYILSLFYKFRSATPLVIRSPSRWCFYFDKRGVCQDEGEVQLIV